MQQTIHTKLGPGRRLAIPAKICEAFDLHPGDRLVIEVRDQDIRLVPYLQVIREVQEAFRPIRDPNRDSVDELIAERRAEAAREEEEARRSRVLHDDRR